MERRDFLSSTLWTTTFPFEVKLFQQRVQSIMMRIYQCFVGQSEWGQFNVCPLWRRVLFIFSVCNTGQGWARAGEGECKVGQTLRGCLRVQWENTREKVVIYQECRVGLLLSSCLKADCWQDLKTSLLNYSTTPRLWYSSDTPAEEAGEWWWSDTLVSGCCSVEPRLVDAASLLFSLAMIRSQWWGYHLCCCWSQLWLHVTELSLLPLPLDTSSHSSSLLSTSTGQNNKMMMTGQKPRDVRKACFVTDQLWSINLHCRDGWNITTARIIKQVFCTEFLRKLKNQDFKSSQQTETPLKQAVSTWS